MVISYEISFKFLQILQNRLKQLKSFTFFWHGDILIIEANIIWREYGETDKRRSSVSSSNMGK